MSTEYTLHLLDVAKEHLMHTERGVPKPDNEAAEKHLLLAIESLKLSSAHPRKPQKPVEPVVIKVEEKKVNNYLAWLWGAIILAFIGGSALFSNHSKADKNDINVPHIHR